MGRSGAAEKAMCCRWKARKKYPAKKIADGSFGGVEAEKTLRVTRGPQADWFPEEVQGMLARGEFVVSEESNRMGLRLDGPRLVALGKPGMVSEGTPLGAIQVTPSGQAIILFVEQQTTGGYPKICECDWNGFAFRGAVAAARYDSVRRSVIGEGAGIVDRAAAVAGFRGAAVPMRCAI